MGELGWTVRGQTERSHGILFRTVVHPLPTPETTQHPWKDNYSCLFGKYRLHFSRGSRSADHHPNPTHPMASAEHLKALLRSHLEGDNDRFISVAMQVAGHEARLGHGKLATDLRDIIDQAKSRRGAGSTVPIARPRGELANLLEASYPKARLGDMILGETLADRIKRVIREQRHAGRILDHGLSPRRKLMLVGPPGTGKTLTASVLAGELGLPLLQVRLDGLITRFMGETAAKLRQIFDATDQT